MNNRAVLMEWNFQHYHWRRQLWGTGARALPINFQQFIFFQLGLTLEMHKV